MQEWVWRNLRFELPRDWEMLQFSRRSETGSCLFADRHAYRFELNWRRVAGAPDFARMLDDYARQLAPETPGQVVRVQQAPWLGLAGTFEGVATSRFGRFLPGEKYLVEAVFLWPRERDLPLERQVLASLDELPRDEQWQRWRAFGLDCRGSAGLELQTCEVQPAAAHLVFAPKGNSLRTEDFSRWGMVEHWLRTGVEDWLAARRPRQATQIATGQRRLGDHQVYFVSARVPGRLLGRCHYQAAAWVCPRDRRLYCVATVTERPLEQRQAPLVGHRLRCCAELPEEAVA